MNTRSANLRGGFTLLELLAAMAVLALLVVMLFSAFGQASRVWLQAENRVESFSAARSALDLMSRELSQAIATSNISFLGSETNVAFVAPVSTQPADIIDLEEVVYRRNLKNNTLERQVTAFPAAGNIWDFYTLPQQWPTTMDKTNVIADNVVLLNFSYVATNGVVIQNCPTCPSWWNSGTLPAWSGTIPAATTYPTPDLLTNHAPAGVQITIGTIDSRALARLRVIAPGGVTNSSNVGAYTNTINQATKYFSTFVAIPNH